MLRTCLLAGLSIVGLVGWTLLARRLAPLANTSQERFDAILILGTPADADGNPTAEQLERVNEAVREYERGVAPRLVFTGGPAHNRFVEAEVMAGAAAAKGIPPSVIFVETKAEDTIQNACYAERLMQAHGWKSAEVVTSNFHVTRAAMIFRHTSLAWRMHGASSMRSGEGGSGTDSLLEILKTMRYLLYAAWTEHCEP
jgi:uncharacterized SAM-binding protein YcdF (DUF218 family)